jgi:hypothetical protein
MIEQFSEEEETIGVVSSECAHSAVHNRFISATESPFINKTLNCTTH